MASKQKTLTIAFVGSAAVRPLTIQSTMNDWLGLGPVDAEGFFEESEKYDVRLIFPAGPEHWNDALENVWKWSAQAALDYDLVIDKNGKTEDLEYVVEDADKVHEVTNVSKAVVDLLDKTDSDEKYIVALWGENGDDEADAVMTFAEAAGIPAKDLTAGLDDLRFGDEDEDEAPEPEPEPVKEERPSRRRRGAKAEEEEEAPVEEEKPRRRRGSKPEPEPQEESLDEDEEALDDEPAQPEPVKEEKPKRAKAKDPDPTPEPVSEEKSWGEAGVGHVKQEIPPVVFEALRTARAYFLLIDESSAMKNLSDEVKPSPITSLLSEALKAVDGLVVAADAPEASKAVSVEVKAEEPRRRGRPRTKEEVFPYLHNEEEGTYRKAGRGRPRRGETRVELTQAQVDDLTAQDLIED